MITSQPPILQLPKKRRRARVLGVGSWLVVLSGVALSVSPAFAQSVDWPTERAPRPLSAREVKFPPFQVKTLANGDVYIRAIDPAYATPGPEEVQKFSE